MAVVPDPDPVYLAAFGKVGGKRQLIGFVDMIPGLFPSTLVKFGETGFRLDNDFRQIVRRKWFFCFPEKQIAHFFSSYIYSCWLLTPGFCFNLSVEDPAVYYNSIFQQRFNFIPRYRFEKSVKNLSWNHYGKNVFGMAADAEHVSAWMLIMDSKNNS